MAKVKLTTGFAGVFAGVDSPAPGTEVEVDDKLAKALIKDGRAMAVKDESNGNGRKGQPKRETAAQPPPPENTSANGGTPPPPQVTHI